MRAYSEIWLAYIFYCLLYTSTQFEMAYALASVNTVERGMGKFIKCDVRSIIVAFPLLAVSDNTAWKSIRDFLHIRNFTINDQSSIFRKKLREKTEGMTDIIEIFKEVEMIGVNIQDNTDLRIKMKKTVCVFTCLCQEYLRISDTNISIDRLQNTAYRDQMCIRDRYKHSL